MKQIYSDLSGDSRLLAQAFPAEREELKRAAATAAEETLYYEQYSPDSPRRVYQWRMSEATFNATFAPWLARVAAWQDERHAVVHFHGVDYIMLLADDAEPIADCALTQCYVEAVFTRNKTESNCLLRDAKSGKKSLRKSVWSLTARRWDWNDALAHSQPEFFHPELARIIAVEKAATLPEAANAKVQLIQGADSASQDDIFKWMDVVSIDGEPNVLTSELHSGLGFPGAGQAVYRVTLRDGSKKLVVEQLVSYAEGYSVGYDFLDDWTRN